MLGGLGEGGDESVFGEAGRGQRGFFLGLHTMKKTIVVVSLFLAALVAGLVLSSVATPPAAKVSEDGGQSRGKETFAQKERGMPLDMQSVDGPGVQGYSGTPPLLGSEPRPISLKPYDMANDQELFMFEGNKISADCCPSPFSTGSGCVCLTESQVASFASRGGNRA
jgi:hypothetical protein